MQKTKKKFIMDCIVIGAALFSMFFGAGNMIFPPALGFQAGTSWVLSFACYFMADIGLAMVTMFAMIRKQGPEGIVAPMGEKIGNAVLAVIALCIGLVIAIPRTAATTYELSIAPLFNEISLPLVCVAFFTVVLLLCLSESGVVDVVGKVLTPVLLVGLLAMIVLGIISPIGPIRAPLDAGAVVTTGIESGYQTMDVLGAIVLGTLVLNSAADKGYSSVSAQAKTSAFASLFATVGLFVVYFGLTYLGATASTLYPEDINHTQLLNNIVSALLPGQAGQLFFGVVVGLACLTTAIALTSATSSFFVHVTKGRIPYRLFVIIVCVASTAIACIGIDNIIGFAGSILGVIYPPILVLVILSFFDKYLSNWTFRFGAFAALVVSVMELFSVGGAVLDKMPLAALGFSWLLPAAVCCVLGEVMYRCFGSKGAKA